MSGLDEPGGIVALGAVELSAAIHGRRVSCAEVMGAYLDRIEGVNPAFNAIVALQGREGLMAQARARDEALAPCTVSRWR